MVTEFRKSEKYALLAVIKCSDPEMGISAVPLEKLTCFSRFLCQPRKEASRMKILKNNEWRDLTLKREKEQLVELG